MCDSLKYLSGIVVPALLLLLLAGRLQPLEAGLTLGSRDIYAGTAKTAGIPIYLANFDKEAIGSLQFKLKLPSGKASVSKLVMTESFKATWTPTQESVEPGTWQISLAGEKDSINAHRQQLVLLEVDISGMEANSTAAISFSEILVNGKASPSFQGIPFKIFKSAASAKGDVNGDSKVDMADISQAFQNLAQGKRPSEDGLELSGVRPVSLYDAALLYQHNTGLLPSLPAPEIPGTHKPDTLFSDSAKWEIAGPNPVIQNLYSYTITARNIKGLISAELTLRGDSEILDGIKQIAVSSAAALKEIKKVNSNEFRLFIISPQAIEKSALPWITIIAQHKAGKSGKGILSVEPVTMNEGRILSQKAEYGCTEPRYQEFKASADINDGSCVNYIAATRISEKIIAAPSTVVFHIAGKTLVISNPGLAAAEFIFMTIRGKHLRHGRLPMETQHSIDLSQWPAGNYFLQITAGHQRIVRPFSLRP